MHQWWKPLQISLEYQKGELQVWNPEEWYISVEKSATLSSSALYHSIKVQYAVAGEVESPIG